MNYAIALNANFPSDTVANPPTWTGQVRLFAGATAPSGYASADGQLVPVNNNLALFQQLGTTYGGNGASTFALPDLRGRAVIHKGSADGVNTHALGDKTGSETVALNDSQLPAHTHSMAAPAIATLSDGGGQPFSNMEPSIALNYIICIQGNFPSANSGANEPFLGELALFAGSVAPRNWAFADGQTVPVSQYTDLFAILGTTYGGNGANFFQLPNLQGRTIVGAGQGPGLADRIRGQSYGEENTALTVSQLPPHAHTYATFDGDYNANGFVDGADFLNWQRGFGVAFPATHS
jgi:microcystin-dependent protein